MMKGVLFDFWGTLVENGLDPSPVKMAYKMFNLGIPFKDFIVRFEESFMTEDVDDLYQAFENVCDEFEVNPRDRFIDSLVGLWNKNDILSKPFPETYEVLKDLKQDGYKLGLVSNSPPSMRRVFEKYEFGNYFDAVKLSCDVGKLKTDPSMFEAILDELDLEEDEVVMVGDTTHTDIEGAEAAGIKPVLIDRNNTRKYKNRITNLSQIYGYLEG